MTTKVNGVATSAESLTGNLDFFTVQTLVEIKSDGTITEDAQKRFDKLVETINLRGQPVVLSGVGTRIAEAGEFLGTNATAGGETVYFFKFAVEHSGLWVEAGNTDEKAVSLAASFDGLLGEFVADGVNDNIEVVFAENL